MLAGHLAVRRRLGEAFAHDLGGLLQLHRLELGGHRLGLGRRGLARLHRVYGLEHGRDLGSLGSGDLGQRVAVVDLLHIFKQFSEGQPCFPELDRAHVAQGRVDPRVVAGPHPLVDPLPQMLGVGKRLAVDEPPLQAVVGRLDHGVVVRAALPRQGSLDAEDLEHLVYRGVGELASAVRVENPDVGQGEPHGGERRLHQAGVAPVADRVPDDLAVAGVDQQADVAPLPPGAHVRQVAYDMGAGCVPVEAPVEQVRQRGLARLRAGRPVLPPRVRAGQAVLPHDSGDAPSRGHDAALLQHHLYLRGPVLAEPLLVGPDHVVGDRVARPFALGMPEHPVVRGPGNA